jgi:hydroxylamine reductase (hybrid-cluster protein)
VAPAPRVFGSPFAVSLLTEKLPGINGGKALVAATPEGAAAGILAHIREKRQALGLPAA